MIRRIVFTKFLAKEMTTTHAKNAILAKTSLALHVSETKHTPDFDNSTILAAERNDRSVL